MRDREFGFARISIYEPNDWPSEPGQRYFKVMDFMISGYAMLMVFFYLGLVPGIDYTKEPLAQMGQMHWLLDIRWFFSIIIVAVSVVHAALIALSEGVEVNDPFPRSSKKETPFTPVLELFRVVINAIIRTLITLLQYIMRIGWELAKSAVHHWKRLRNATITVAVMSLYVLGCLALRVLVVELWSYQSADDLLDAFWPFAQVLFGFLLMILVALLINYLMHCTMERWLTLVDAEEWTTWSNKRSLAAPAFTAFALWFSALVLLGLSRIDALGLSVYRAAGPFVLLFLSTMIVGGAYKGLLAWKEARTKAQGTK